jgi:Zn finger protein HypA/HybF involved in hydrogenase expression
MKLKCNRCKKEWEYKGKITPNKEYPQYTSCPRCKSSVKIEKVSKDGI